MTYAPETEAEENFFMAADPGDTESPVVTLDQTDVFEVIDLTAITITDNIGFTYKLRFPESGMTKWLTMDGRGIGDFGPEWNLPPTDTKAQITVPLGKMWSETKGGGFIPTYFLMELRQHIVVIRFSDGELLKFKMKVSPDNSLVFPVGKLSPGAGFAPPDTTKGTPEAPDFDSKRLLLLFGRHYKYGSRLCDPKRFKYTNLDGTEYVIHTDKGIEWHGGSDAGKYFLFCRAFFHARGIMAWIS